MNWRKWLNAPECGFLHGNLSTDFRIYCIIAVKGWGQAGHMIGGLYTPHSLVSIYLLPFSLCFLFHACVLNRLAPQHPEKTGNGSCMHHVEHSKHTGSATVEKKQILVSAGLGMWSWCLQRVGSTKRDGRRSPSKLEDPINSAWAGLPCNDIRWVRSHA